MLRQTCVGTHSDEPAVPAALFDGIRGGVLGLAAGARDLALQLGIRFDGLCILKLDSFWPTTDRRLLPSTLRNFATDSRYSRNEG